MTKPVQVPDPTHKKIKERAKELDISMSAVVQRWQRSDEFLHALGPQDIDPETMLDQLNAWEGGR